MALDSYMEQALLEQIQQLSESVQQEALRYIQDLVAKQTQSAQTVTYEYCAN
jgi:Protein of unknown function (DUF2281)